ncbi:MAG: DUF4340 domain-containing protein [Candidatus Riflebacteria bacterium]|nr:DUF4340 domain-containing protein [Candidatus Riflebacteria bacterium]
MKKRFLPTVIAFSILLILLIYANYFEVDVIIPPGAQKPELIIGCTAAEITSITWKRGPENDIKLVIASDSSRLVAPDNYICDKNEVEGLCKHFAGLRYEMVVAVTATDTAGYGIDSNSPAVVIEVGSRSSELYLGRKTEIGGSYYLAKKDDSRVFMVPGYIHGDFNKTLDDLRERRWFSEDLGQINRISITTPEAAVELRLGDSFSEWYIDQPASYSADGVAVAEIIERMRNLRISRFVDDEPAEDDDYGFASAGLVLHASNRAGVEFAIETGEILGVETFVRKIGKPAIHAMLNSDLNELKRNVNDLRDKYLMVPRVASITEMTVADASASITIERKEDKWLIGDQVVADADVKAFVRSLVQARIVSYGNLEKLDEHGLNDKNNCRYVEIKAPERCLLLWIGTRQGVNLSVMDAHELMIINVELDDALQLLMGRIRKDRKISVVASEDYDASIVREPASSTITDEVFESKDNRQSATGTSSN